MFPTAHSVIYRNEAGEPLGWDSPDAFERPNDPDDFYAQFEDNGDDVDPPAHNINLQATRHQTLGTCTCGAWTVAVTETGPGITAATNDERRALVETAADRHLDQVAAIGEDDTAGWNWDPDAYQQVPHPSCPVGYAPHQPHTFSSDCCPFNCDGAPGNLDRGAQP